jgi:hypothetical protein
VDDPIAVGVDLPPGVRRLGAHLVEAFDICLEQNT